MKKMKKLLCMLMCLLLTFSLAACAASAPAEPAAPAAAAPAQEPAVAEPTAEPELTEEEAWKLEQRYGTTLHYYISDGCSAGPSVADALGYYAEAGLTVEGLKGEGNSDVDALGTAAVEISVGHFA